MTVFGQKEAFITAGLEWRKCGAGMWVRYIPAAVHQECTEPSGFINFPI
jgi:hypothetical protein